MFYNSGSTLVLGPAGCGKSSAAAHFANLSPTPILYYSPEEPARVCLKRVKDHVTVLLYQPPPEGINHDIVLDNLAMLAPRNEDAFALVQRFLARNVNICLTLQTSRRASYDSAVRFWSNHVNHIWAFESPFLLVCRHGPNVMKSVEIPRLHPRKNDEPEPPTAWERLCKE